MLHVKPQYGQNKWEYFFLSKWETSSPPLARAKSLSGIKGIDRANILKETRLAFEKGEK